MAHTPGSYDSFQAFLDGNQYTEEGIRRYEYIFGKTYVSTGGQETTEKFVKTLNLKKGDSVLDVGCGIGGSAFHIAREYGAKVHGIDLSTNMISMAVKYQAEMEESVRKNVSFEMSDITKHNFEPNSFDVIYSRDTILHIGEKDALFTKFFNWLKPGGKLMISDYCHGDKEEHSEAYLQYVLQRCYLMLTVPEYGQLLERVGFVNVQAIDKTAQFMDILNIELKRFVENKAGFLAQFKEYDYDYIVEGWKSKLDRCSAGDQAWGLFTATKPL
jgi:phosphoethanolamine N-methyltransferase